MRLQWRGAWAASLVFGIAMAAHGAEFSLGEARVRVNGIGTFGMGWRADGRDPELIPPQNGNALGIGGRAAAGQNSDDGNLNYARGSRVSTALRASADIDVTLPRGLRAFSRVRAWTDTTMEDSPVPWGNVANGYAQQQPLSDAGFNRLAKFSNAVVMDAFVQAPVPLHQASFVRLGRQAIPWGIPGTSAPGGLDQINAMDLTARTHAGWTLDDAVYKESLDGDMSMDDRYYRTSLYHIPALAAYASLDLGAATTVQAFYQFSFEPTQLPGCGTFYAFADYVTSGCDKVLVGPGRDSGSVATGAFGKRAPDGMPSGGGQYGLGINRVLPDIGLVGAYVANIHSRRFALDAVKSTRSGLPPLIPGDPGGANVQYRVEYPEDVQLFGLNWFAKHPKSKISAFAELTYSPNQMFRLNATDLLNGFASNVAPSALRADATATAPGAIFQGYDRHKVIQANVGGRLPFGFFPAAKNISLSGELSGKYVPDMPDVALRRYGRNELFGLGPVNGACAGTPRQCSTDGYATSVAWGYRVRMDMRVPTGGDVVLNPYLMFLHDVRGWSYDDVFNEGRQSAVVALRAIAKKRYVAEASWISVWGGGYNIFKDRDIFVASVGVMF
jgi:Protein of unknown function (DUF1302)